MAWKFDPARAEKLSDPGRLESLDPSTMWAAAAVPSPGTIVDIGAGTGLITASFARLAPEAHVYAVDVSPEMLAFMRERLPADLSARIEPLLAEETHVPLPDGVADLVTMVALYHELDDPEATLSEALRLLAPRGRLLVVDWKKKETPHGPPLAARVSGEDIAAVMREAGFERVRIHDVLADFSVVTGGRG